MILSCLLPLLISPSTLAAVPIYSAPEILARANGPESLNLPPWAFLSNATPILSHHGDVSFRVVALEGNTTPGLWVKKSTEPAGRIVYRGPEGKFMSDPAMNEKHQVVFSIFEEGASEGLFVYNHMTGDTQNILTAQNSDVFAFGYPQILNDGSIYFRATHQSNDRSLYRYASTLKQLVTEGEDFYGFKASYLFSPVWNHQQQTAFKIRLGNRKDWDNKYPDQILLLEKDGRFRIVAADRKSNARSPYIGFTNSVALSENGLVAFVAELENGKKTLVLDEGGLQVRLATEGLNDISELELFPPRINSAGLVVFRARNAHGKRGLYAADRTDLRRLLGENDEIPADLGKALILSDKNYPAFSGGVSLNDRNELVFHTLITSPQGESWGSAIYKMTPLP